MSSWIPSHHRGFEQELQTILDLRQRKQISCAVLMIDLDRFKDVNDSMGHAAGDELLQQVGQRLKVLLRSKDTIARLGGDEFAIVQYNVRSPGNVALVATLMERADSALYAVKKAGRNDWRVWSP